LKEVSRGNNEVDESEVSGGASNAKGKDEKEEEVPEEGGGFVVCNGPPGGADEADEGTDAGEAAGSDACGASSNWWSMKIGGNGLKEEWRWPSGEPRPGSG
jgi:hypothetical protein